MEERASPEDPAQSSAEQSPPRDDRCGDRAMVVALIVLAMLAVSWVVDWHRLSIDGLDGALNDQVGYISVARRLADHGTLDSGIIYPGLLRQHAHRNTLYMPGYYLTLAAAIKLLGYSDAIARIPSILAFLLSCWLTFWIARRLYSERVAFLASALFAFTPLCLVFAFTAMSEMATVIAVLAAFAIFLWIPEDKRIWIAPLTLALPIAFRETGVLLGIVMLAMIASSTQRNRLGTILLCGALMLAVFVAILVSPIGAGRPSLWKQNILVGTSFEVLYVDAYAMDNVSSTPEDWAEAIRAKAAYNFKSLLHPIQSANGAQEQEALWFLLSGVPLGLLVWFRKRDFFALGVALGLAALLAATLSLYSMWGYRGVRVLLMFLPFVAMLWSKTLCSIVRDRAALSHALVLALFLAGTWSAVRLIRAQAEADAGAHENTAFLETIVRPEDKLLAAPFWLSLDFVNQHYPIRWSFVPANCETLRLLDERYTIGTLVVPLEEANNSMYRKGTLCDTGLRWVGEKVQYEDRFWVYQRTSSE